MAELDEEIESMLPATRVSRAGGGRRKPSAEIPDLLAKHPEGLTIKEIMAALAMKYPQVYVTVAKLKKPIKSLQMTKPENMR